MKHTLLVSLCLAWLCAGTAAGATIHIVEAGFLLGGPLTVDGTGTDTDFDNVLALTEFTSLTAVYDIAGGGTLTWDQADFLLGAFGIGPLADAYLFLAQNPGGAAVIASAGGGSSSAQVADGRIGLQDTASTSAVPEPGLSVLAGLALAAMVRKGWSARRRPSSK